jgi:hypothetical protein
VSDLPYGGAGDSRTAGRSLSDRFRRHADALVRSERSPLYVELMRAAAQDIDSGGLVAALFDDVAVPPGAVPQLRLVAALHQLVLSGRAPALAAYYPSAGGDLAPDGVWPVAQAAIREHFEWLKPRVARTVQTNEPGRSAVLFPALLWLTDRYRKPIRLLEIGASAGLNLVPDRYSYVIAGRQLGAPESAVRFVDPWTPPPPIDLAAAASALVIAERAGCDLSPLDPTEPDDQLTLLSYIWPDELYRIERLRAALAVAASDPVPVVRARASEWLPDAIGADGTGQAITVVWHSLFRQYLEPSEWEALQDVFRATALGTGAGTAVWVSMEPALDHLAGVQLALRTDPDEPGTTLAVCDDHGLPIRWRAATA